MGPDGVPAELLKLGLQQDRTILPEFQGVTTLNWREGKVLQQWKHAVMPVHPKRVRRRSVETTVASRSCLTHAVKFILQVVARRLSAYCEAKVMLPEEQCGFRPNLSTTDMMFVVRRLEEIGRKAGVFL